MWRRLPARRLASALFSSFLPRAADAFPLDRCLLTAASGLLPPPSLHPWGLQLLPSRFVSSAAEAVSSEDLDELNHALEDVVRADQNRQPPRMPAGTTGEAGRGQQTAAEHGMAFHKYSMLRRRQIRIETEAWVQAAKEYRELLADMCEQKLAPNLPYESLFLGWFEPLREQITAEQELVAEHGSHASHRPYFNMLPADMMAVITMHKLMGLLMTGNSDGSVRVIQAACQIGEAIEHEVRVYKFLEKTKKKSKKEIDNEEEVGDSDITQEQQRLRKKVTDLMKKGKTRIVRNIVKNYDSSRPWGQEAQAKVGSRLIELFIETAHTQPPSSQSSDDPPDIRPAFRHEMRTVPDEQQKLSRRYGVIKCDPLVRQGLDRTAKHMVIPYMPMLIPPISWTGYDKGAHLFLPSYIMRTRGARQQREAVKMVPAKQMHSVFEHSPLSGFLANNMGTRDSSRQDLLEENKEFQQVRQEFHARTQFNVHNTYNRGTMFQTAGGEKSSFAGGYPPPFMGSRTFNDNKQFARKVKKDFVHILLKGNKTFVTVTDAKGNKKTGASAGCLEDRKGRSRQSRYAAEATAEHVGRSARKMGLRSVVVKVKGASFFRKKKKVILAFREGFRGERVRDQLSIMAIHDVTQLPHNGCRLPKQRRI